VLERLSWFFFPGKGRAGPIEKNSVYTRRMLRLILLPLAAALAGCTGPSSRLISPPLDSACAPVPARTRLKVVSFNIRSGLSSSISDVAQVLGGMDADVIALQEVDVGTGRAARANQAEAIALKLGGGYRYVFAAAMSRDGGDYGVALLSRLPFQRAERVDLRAPGALEPRTAIDATVCAGEVPVRVVAVHADVMPWAATDNARALVKALSAGPAHMVVAGDLNAQPKEDGPQAFNAIGLLDIIGLHAEGPTFHFPTGRRLDYIFAARGLADDGVTAGRVASEVSDHWPIHAELAWPVN